MPLFAENWESLIAFVVIMLLSGIGNWLKQRKNPQPETWGDEEEPGQPVPPVRRTPLPPEPTPRTGPEPVFDLERELRRMLGQEPEPPSPAPAPVLREPPPVPPPVVVSAPSVRRAEAPPPPPPGRVLYPSSYGELDSLEAPTFDLAPLSESAAAYQRASAIDEQALAKLEAARLRTGQPHATASRTPLAKPASAEIAAVLASLHHPRTARQAVLASVILGPPKSAEF